METPTHFEFCWGLDTLTHFEFPFVCVRGRKFHKARSEKRQQEFCKVRGIVYRSRSGSLAAASPSTPPRPAVASPSLPEPSPLDPVRRLHPLGGYTSTVNEPGSVPASRSPSPAVKIVSDLRITSWARAALHLRKKNVSIVVPSTGPLFFTDACCLPGPVPSTGRIRLCGCIPSTITRRCLVPVEVAAGGEGILDSRYLTHQQQAQAAM